MATFDPYDWESFFFGALERENANKFLEHSSIGAFLLRESRSRPSGYSLSVRECSHGDHQIYHYFIEKKIFNESQVFEMCGNSFIDIPSLITYYQLHVLEKSTLTQPILRQALCKVIGRYKFDGERVSDLPFERGEVLEIIGKPEELWWTARNSLNNIGLIPVPYIKLYEDGDEISLLNPSTNSSSGGSVKRSSTISVISESSVLPGQRDSFEANNLKLNSLKHSLEDVLSDNHKPDVGKNSVKCALSSSKGFVTPAWVRVIADRFPSIYDTDALTLKQGQLVYVLEIFSTGMCRGQIDVNGRIGVFPISYVEWTNISSESGPWSPLEV